MPPHAINAHLLCRAVALIVITLGVSQIAQAAADHALLANTADARIEAMKSNPRGPFSRIRWFCKDGQILPPQPSACKPFGGGSQHGEYTEDTRALRAAGYTIANIYADLDLEALAQQQRLNLQLGQMAIEQFLIQVDNGWILRRAQYYRGALQAEGERSGAKKLLQWLAEQEAFITTHYLSWRTLASLLPHGSDTASAKNVRQNASMLAERDKDFLPLKNKIHITPDAADAARVREYAAGVVDDAELVSALNTLAADIDALYAIDLANLLGKLNTRLDGQAPALAAAISAAQARLGATSAALSRFTTSADLLLALREALPTVKSSSLRLALADAANVIESEHFAAASTLAPNINQLPRGERARLLLAATRALYGTGLISARQLNVASDYLNTLVNNTTLPLPQYREIIADLSLVTGWADRKLYFAFGDAMAKLGEIEPLARLFIQDQLRGSPMFFYAALIDTLVLDANQLAGVQHQLFEKETGAGLRALNPGLARGILRDGRNLGETEFSADGIYLLPETIADLPPVAGILTAGEGNPLSHVQLLARNLGIPNVSIATNRLDVLAAHEGEAVVMAVSAGGAVHLRKDSAEFDVYFKQAAEKPRHLIEPDLDKLDLSEQRVLNLSALRATDSGRTVGPKAAKLGELKAHYPRAVADGLALPFGIFRALLNKPSPRGELPMFDWIVQGYRAVEALPANSAERVTRTEQLRAQIEQWILAKSLDSDIQQSLREQLTQTLGADGEFGVFVRSDTNVEDLPGFTGAGLNLTVANVVGINNIIEAIPRVWASPFTARAFSWRQALMREPEHVYPAVLLLESVNADKSGVLVTQDIDSGSREWISVAVNEGVGGAVDGQSAESLRIHLPTGRVRLLAEASASLRRQVAAHGGVSKIPASGRADVLQPAEIKQLIEFATQLPQQFPAIVDADGRSAPADVEFGFQNGELRLFQIRPFLDNAAARGNSYLSAMDPATESLQTITVELNAATP